MVFIETLGHKSILLETDLNFIFTPIIEIKIRSVNGNSHQAYIKTFKIKNSENDRI